MAGREPSGFGGDGGPAIAANLSDLRALVFDRAGNLYISDSSGYRIRKISTSGVITTIAGNGSAGDGGDGGPALSAQFRASSCLATDNSGSLYICDRYRIRKIDAGGVITTIAGVIPTAGFTRDGLPANGSLLSPPRAILVDAKGNIYFTESHRIRVITKDGILRTVAGSTMAGFAGDGGPAIEAKLHYPAGLAIDAAGNLYVSDAGNHRLRKLNLNAPQQLQVVSGDGQTGPPGGCLSPLRARVDGSAGIGVPGTRVDFTVTSGKASVAATATTGSDGVVAAAITLGDSAGEAEVRASSAGLSPVTFHLTAQPGGNAATPCIAPGGILSAGLGAVPLRSLSPGALSTVFGQKFTEPGAERGIISADIQTGVLPTTLAGVCVMVGGIPAPLLYVGQQQINFQAPALAETDAVPIEVFRNCGTAEELRSNRENVLLIESSPELLALAHNAEGGNPIVAIDASDQALIGDEASLPGLAVRAARKGSVVMMFAIGLGSTNPPITPGVLATSAASVTHNAHVEIQEWELDSSDVLYAGLTPGFAGLYQISFRVPQRYALSPGYVAIAVRIGNVRSPAGTYLYLER